MLLRPWRARLLAILLLVSPVLLAACSAQSNAANGELYVQDLVEQAQTFNGQEVTVIGAYVQKPGDPPMSVLALGLSTLDNGLQAEPLGNPIWVENFPQEALPGLHQPGDAIYGFVRANGLFESSGGYGPDGSYQYRLQVTSAEPIEQIRRIEHTLGKQPPGEGQVALAELQRNPQQYNGQTVTTQGYYFWNSVIYVLSEGVSTEEGGASPQPIGEAIWMEGFPPDKSAELNVGPNNSYVWGPVEVTGTFQTGGGFGKDGQYQSILVVESATPLEPRGQ